MDTGIECLNGLLKCNGERIVVSEVCNVRGGIEYGWVIKGSFKCLLMGS